MSICAGGGGVNVCPYGLAQHKALCQAQKCSNRQGDILFVYVETDGNKPDICKWYYNSECNVWFQDFLSSRFFLAFWEYQYHQSRYNWALFKEGLSVSIAHKSQSSETQAAPVYQTMGLSFRPIYTSRLTLNCIFIHHSSPHILSQYEADYNPTIRQLHWEVEKPQRGSTLWPTTWGLEGLLAWMDGNLTQRFRPTLAL